jgi:flagellar protein FliS
MTYEQQVQAYKTASHMVRKTKQVVMLYEGAIRSVQQAKQAIIDNDIQDRYNLLTKSCDIINGLQLSLDMKNGGEVSELLYDYYSGLDMRLMSIHETNSAEMCDACVRHLKMMKDAWEEIDSNIDNDVAAQVSSFTPTEAPSPAEQQAIREAMKSINMNA